MLGNISEPFSRSFYPFAGACRVCAVNPVVLRLRLGTGGASNPGVIVGLVDFKDSPISGEEFPFWVVCSAKASPESRILLVSLSTYAQQEDNCAPPKLTVGAVASRSTFPHCRSGTLV